MSDITVHNLLVGSHDLSTALWFNKAKRSDKTFWGAAVADFDMKGGIYFPNDTNMADARATSGAEYVLSFFARADVAGDKIHSDVWGSKYMLDTELTTEWQQVVMPYGIVNADHREIFIYGLGTNSGTVQVALPMCVRGTEPSAWAPAEGESLTGGTLMSANLLDGITPKLLNGATYDGTAWLTPARPDTANTPTYYLEWPLSQARLATNQTYRVAMGTMGDGGSGYLTAYLAYKDAAGNSIAVAVAIAYGTSWARSEATMVVPSGMTPYLLSICKWGKHPAVSVAGVVLSYGSPVTLASSAHTPYATQDHVAAEYSTKASQKILSDSITSEVKARAKTDGAVSELSTKMEQTVKGINVSLDTLTATEKQIHSWFDFGSDASGNPKLAMGSSSSPIIGEYSNSGTAYKDRSGATLLALDAANSTTGADHVVAKDISIGKWQWVPTNGGDNLTLVWIGG